MRALGLRWTRDDKKVWARLVRGRWLILALADLGSAGWVGLLVACVRGPPENRGRKRKEKKERKSRAARCCSVTPAGATATSIGRCRFFFFFVRAVPFLKSVGPPGRLPDGCAPETSGNSFPLFLVDFVQETCGRADRTVLRSDRWEAQAHSVTSSSRPVETKSS